MSPKLPRKWIPFLSLLAGCLVLAGPFPASAADSAPQDANAPAWEADTRASLDKMAATLTDTLKPWPVPDRTFRVEDYGAKPDGVTVNTAALQSAIDACSAAGGGVVLLASGDYVTGTIELKSGVMLEVDKGAKIVGSTSLADYPDKVAAHETVMDTLKRGNKSLIRAENCERIGIRGDGVIDGRGQQKNFPSKQPKASLLDRPFLMRIIECRKIVVDGIHLRNSASWLEDYLNCDDLIIQGINVENQGNLNNDGFDIDGCRNVIVRKCFFNTYDDGMCFKGLGMRTTQNVLVEDCTAYCSHFGNPLKFGTESEGGIQNLLVRNIKIGGTPADLPCFQRESGSRSISGISWESVDGATVENILVTNARIDRAESPIFLRLGNRARTKPDLPKPPPGNLRHLIFDHITGGNNGARGSIIAGIPGTQVRDVVIRDMNLSMAGGGKSSNAKLPENIPNYPDSYMFGPESPAYGFWMRHAQGITLQGVKITPVKPDARPQFDADEDTAAILIDGTPAPMGR